MLATNVYPHLRQPIVHAEPSTMALPTRHTKTRAPHITTTPQAVHWTLVVISLILGVALLFAFSYLGTVAFAHASSGTGVVRSWPVPTGVPYKAGGRSPLESGRQA